MKSQNNKFSSELQRPPDVYVESTVREIDKQYKMDLINDRLTSIDETDAFDENRVMCTKMEKCKGERLTRAVHAKKQISSTFFAFSTH